MVYLLKKPSTYLYYHGTMEAEYLHQGYSKSIARQYAALEVLKAAGYHFAESLDEWQFWIE